MLNFKPSKMTLALLSSGLITLSTQAFAVEETKVEEQAV